MEYLYPVCCAESTNPLYSPPWRFERIKDAALVIKGPGHTLKVHRDTTGEVSPVKPCPDCPRPIPGATSSSKASLHQSRGAQGHKEEQEHKLRTQRKGKMGIVPEEPQFHCQEGKCIMRSQWWSTFRLEKVAAWGYKETLWDVREKEFWD